MRISVHHLLRAGISAAALLLAACRSTRDPGCAPDGTGGKGTTGMPGARAAQPRFYPGQEPRPAARPLADAGGWRLGGRGPKFLPIGAESTPAPHTEAAESAFVSQPGREASEFLTSPPVGAWPPRGYAATQLATTRRRPGAAPQTASSTPKKLRTPRTAPALLPASKAEPAKPDIASAPPATKPATPGQTAKAPPARPPKLTDIPRPGQNAGPEDALEKLRRRAEESLSGN